MVKQIKLRPHHVDRFLDYYFNQQNEGFAREVYGLNFIADVNNLWRELIKTNENLRIKIVASLDSICEMCNKKHDSCGKKDDLSVQGYGLLLDYSGLEIGRVYSQEEFLQAVRKVYPHKKPRDNIVSV